MDESVSIWGEDQLVFNNSINHLCGAIDLIVLVGEGKRQRTITLLFLVIQCKSPLKWILESSIQAKLDFIVSTVQLKIAYHGERGVSTIINVNLQEAKRIRRRIHKDILTSASKSYDKLYLDVREGKINPTSYINFILNFSFHPYFISFTKLISIFQF